MQNKLAEIVTEVGKEINRNKKLLIVGGRWHGNQLKTKADMFAHKLLTSKLLSLNNLPIISEEDNNSHKILRPKQYWIIDPIDGTRSFVDGFPGWVVQVALVIDGKPKASAIFAPDIDLLYTAQEGAGAYCNGKKLIVSEESHDRKILIDNYHEPRGIANNIMKGMSCTNYVESGSISLKICRIADGTADMFIKDVTIRDWDVAAPMLVLEEAGGFMLQYNGSLFNLSNNFDKNGLIVARSKKLINSILEFLDEI
jgi:3'(2'), 5'-bisphosphate nucleotidase